MDIYYYGCSFIMWLWKVNDEFDVKIIFIDVIYWSNLNVMLYKWLSFYKDEDEMFIFFVIFVFKVEWNIVW